MNDKEIIIVYDIDGNIWFKIKNILEVLSYTGTLKQLNNIKINKNNSKLYRDIKVPQSIGVPVNIQPATKLINESGLYELLSISTKPLAKLFMNKYFAEIMPTIRQTGKYILDTHDKINFFIFVQFFIIFDK